MSSGSTLDKIEYVVCIFGLISQEYVRMCENGLTE